MNAHKTTRMKLAELLPHPLQGQFFSDCPAADDKTLADDLRTNGQRDAIVVMPPDNAAGLPGGTVLDGNRRRKALQSLGETEAIVLVRHDLKHADAAAVEQVFLRFNFT